MFKPRRDSFSGNRGGSGNFGGSRERHGRNDRHFSGGGGGFDRDERPSFDAVCDQCGKSCTVPFKPTGSRPVLCRQCFKNEGGGGSDRPSYRDRGNDRGNDRDSRRAPESQMDTANLERQLKKINDRLDLILDALAPAAPPKKKEKAAKKNKKEKKEAVIEEEIVEEDAIDEDDDIDEDDEDLMNDEDPIDDEDSEDQST
jgi:CxxC-x17-CxxC domain-containing protein